MGRVVRGVDDGVDIRVGDERMRVAGRPGPGHRGDGGGPFPVDVGDAHDLGAGHPAVQGVHVVGAHGARADDPDAHGAHARLTHVPCAAERSIASSATALATASPRVAPTAVPSAMERRNR